VTVPRALVEPQGTALTVAHLGIKQTLLGLDPLTQPVAAVFGPVAALSLAYAYAPDADRRTSGYTLAYMGASVAAVLAGDWLTLVLAWKLMTVAASVILVGFTAKAAVYIVLRLVPDDRALVAWMGGAMIIDNVWIALLRTTARRLLSYHIISQVGYIKIRTGNEIVVPGFIKDCLSALCPELA
jgi:multicomponent Na+:H+ antiporter subunit D